VNWLWQIFDPATISAFFTQFQIEMQQPTFWVALGKIMWINILLSGDNALVIAMACRGLPPRQRFWGMVLEPAVPQAGRRIGAARDRGKALGA
jgi:hypothetical protein